MLSIAVLIASGLVAQASAASSWNYIGVSTWPDNFEGCAGTSQSPINIDRMQAKYEVFYPPFKFMHYGLAPNTASVSNNGHSAVIAFDDIDMMPTMEGAFLAGEYTFAQYHFHWGADGTKGSEHTLNTVQYPMEVHLVHFKSEYGTLSDAVAHDDGLAVLGIFFVMSENDNPALAPLVDALEDITASGDSVTINNAYALASLLPENTKKFYRYPGGLTTPACNEIVTWTVFNDPIPVSEAQMMKFRALIDSDGNAMVDNYRPVQPLNGRMVKKSFF